MLDVQAKELLRLEAKFFHHSLEPNKGDKLLKLYPLLEKNAELIKTAGSSLQAIPHIAGKLQDLRRDVEFLDFLRSGFSSPISSGKIWGDSNFREMVAFTKQRFGPAYSLLLICIFGTKGYMGSDRLSTYQLAKIVQRIGQDTRQGYLLHCPELERCWESLVGEPKDDCPSVLSVDGSMQTQAEERIVGDPQGTSTHRSEQKWHATVMNEGYSKSLIKEVFCADSITEPDIICPEWSTRRRQLLVLLHFMGGSCSRRDILRRGLLPQGRWGQDGSRTIASPTEMMDFVELFANEFSLDQEIHGCAYDGLIEELTQKDGTCCYTLKSGLEGYLRLYSRQLWVALLAFVAYIYPRHDALEQS